MIPVHAFFLARAQGLADGFIGLHDGRLLPHPSEFIGFVAFCHIGGEHLFQKIEVDGLPELPISAFGLGDAIREEGPDLFYILLYHVDRFHFHLFHVGSPSFV